MRLGTLVVMGVVVFVLFLAYTAAVVENVRLRADVRILIEKIVETEK